MTSKDRLDEEIRGLTGRLAHARDSLGKGVVPDLASLEPVVARLCRDILNCPTAETRELKPALLTVIDELDCLEVALKSELDEVKGQIGEAADRRRAADAYARR